MFHWTEQKIRVHAFYCVLALAIAHLTRRQAVRAGLDFSVREFLHTLAAIQETVLLPIGRRPPPARRMLTDRDPAQQRLFELSGLSACASALRSYIPAVRKPAVCQRKRHIRSRKPGNLG
jgi:hypothetical protein